MNLRDRLDFMRRGFGVRRYHQRYTSVIDTVGKHSAGVAGFILLMYRDSLPSSALLAAALCHDLPECETGDIPSPAKRNMSEEARAALTDLEDEWLDESGFDYHRMLSKDEHRQLKLADVFDGLMFCIEELRRGNKEVVSVGSTYVGYMNNIELKSLESEIAFHLQQLWIGEL